MSRRKTLTAREPSGRPQRQPNLPPPTEVARLRDAALAGMRDSVWGTSLGRLYLAGKLTSSQFAAGKRWAELATDYSKACQGPRIPQSAKLERGDGMAVDPDSAAGHKEARRHVAVAEAYLAACRLLRLMDKAVSPAVRDVCEHNQHPAGIFQLTALRGGLSALAVLWGGK